MDRVEGRTADLSASLCDGCGIRRIERVREGVGKAAGRVARPCFPFVEAGHGETVPRRKVDVAAIAP